GAPGRRPAQTVGKGKLRPSSSQDGVRRPFCQRRLTATGTLPFIGALSYVVQGDGAFGLPFQHGSLVMRETWTFPSAGQILFGRHAAHQLGEIAQRLQAKRVLIVTDSVLVKAGLAERLREPLERAQVAVECFTVGEPEPSFRAAEAW